MRTERPLAHAAVVALLAVFTWSCAGNGAPRTTAESPTRVDLAQLWLDPTDLATRDFFNGPGGEARAPDASAHYEVLARDSKGYSRGYDVRDPHGVKWSVKIGNEAQPEVVVSRLLWGIGYHQPPVYLLPDWRLGAAEGAPGPARFRRSEEGHKVVAEWAWYENPFVGTQPFKGLVVANLMVNNWDWKTSNNKVYDIPDAQGGTGRLYVVRDLGASLGKTDFPQFLRWTPMRGLKQGSRNDLEGFERQGFIERVAGERVEFHFKGIHPDLVKTITPSDVIWTCRLMARITDDQWRDAFRAGGYPPSSQQRYIAKLKAKIAEGLALGGA